MEQGAAARSVRACGLPSQRALLGGDGRRGRFSSRWCRCIGRLLPLRGVVEGFLKSCGVGDLSEISIAEDNGGASKNTMALSSALERADGVASACKTSS